MEVKINIRDCDLVFLENASHMSTLSLPLRLTTLVHLHFDVAGIPTIIVNAQSAQLFCACMSTPTDVCQLTNNVALAIDVVRDRPANRQPVTQRGVSTHGLQVLSDDVVLHRMNIHFSTDLMARLTYRDYLALCAVLEGLSISSASTSSVSTPQPHNMGRRRRASSKAEYKQSGLLIHRIVWKVCHLYQFLFYMRALVQADDVSVWLLDDYLETRFPLARVGARAINFDQQILMEPRPGACSLEVYADYFNQSVYGWEPLIEPYKIDHIGWKHDQVNFHGR